MGKKKFKMVHATNADKFEQEVNNLLDDGWELHGYTMVQLAPKKDGDGSARHYFQALTKAS